VEHSVCVQSIRHAALCIMLYPVAKQQCAGVVVAQADSNSRRRPSISSSNRLVSSMGECQQESCHGAAAACAQLCAGAANSNSAGIL
jgi:hypothetical protein